MHDFENLPLRWDNHGKFTIVPTGIKHVVKRILLSVITYYNENLSQRLLFEPFLNRINSNIKLSTAQNLITGHLLASQLQSVLSSIIYSQKYSTV